MNITQQSPVRKALGAAAAIAVIVTGAGLAGTTTATAAGASAARASVTAPAAAPARAAAVSARAVIAPMALGQGPVLGDCVGSCTLDATAGFVDVVKANGTAHLHVWNFVKSGTAAAGRSAVLVGRVNEPMTITLHNSLSQKVGLAIPGLEDFKNADLTGVAPGDPDRPYTFTPTRPGTYVYQASLTSNGARQTAMGLAGALIVLPALGTASPYQTDDEAVLVYTDIDSHFAADPLGFNMRDYRPEYHFVNGVAYTGTVASSIFTQPSNKLLLRFANASILDKSPTLLGTTMHEFARGARVLKTPLDTSGRLIAPGDTIDASLTMPATNTRFAIYDAPGQLSNYGELNGNNSPALGGAMTFIESGGQPNVLPVGPLTSTLSVVGQPGGTGRPLSINATISGRNGYNVATAEYFVDAIGAPLGGTTLTATYGVPSVTVSGNAINLTSLASGIHTLSVHALDDHGAWGPFRSITFRVDKDGPETTGVTLSSSYLNGTTNLTFSATLDETNTGGSNVIKAGAAIPNSGQTGRSARAWLDQVGPPANTPTGITIVTNAPRVVAAASGTVSAGTLAAPGPLRNLTEGSHTLYIQGQDQWGQWGAPAGTVFTIDKHAPITQTITLRPSVTNGTSGNPAKPGTIGVSADVVDPVNGGANSPLSMVELYVGAVAPSGSVSGIQMSYSGPGQAPGSSKYVADLPLSWLGGYKTSTTVPIFVVAKDLAGNRPDGINTPYVSTPLTIDKDLPTANGTLTQGAYPNDGTVTLVGTFTDAGLAPSGITSAEWWIGAGPVTPFVLTQGANNTATGSATLSLASLGLTSGGTLSVNVRAHDAVNTSTTTVVTLVVRPVQIFADGFEATSLPGPWTSQTVVGTGAGLNLTTTNPVAGSRSLLASTTTATPVATGTAYITKDVPAAVPPVGSFSAHFTFAPGTGNTGSGTTNYVTVFSGTAANGASAVQVRYQRQTNGTVRFAVCNATGGLVPNPVQSCSAFTTVTSATSYVVSVDYNSLATASITLKVNTTTVTRTLQNTANYGIAAVKLGVLARSAAVATSIRFDAFASARVPF